MVCWYLAGDGSLLCSTNYLPLYDNISASQSFLMYPVIPFRYRQTDTKLILDEETISD